jgi:hypothetical protein
MGLFQDMIKNIDASMARCDKYFNGSPRTEEYRQFINGTFG